LIRARRFNLNLTGSATNVAVIQAGGTWRNLAAGDVTPSIAESATPVRLTSMPTGTPCEMRIRFQIRSSVSGTARNLVQPGASTGTFSMTDVDVQDQKVPGGLGTFPYKSL